MLGGPLCFDIIKSHKGLRREVTPFFDRPVTVLSGNCLWKRERPPSELDSSGLTNSAVEANWTVWPRPGD